MSLKIEHAHLVLPYQVLQDAWLISREGKITAYGCGVSPQQTFSTVIDAKGQYLTPGFVDLHVHGGAGADFRDGEEAAFVRAMQAHLAGGTTTMLATVSSTTLEGTLESLRIYEAMRQREAQLPPLPRLAGVHLEGPYFSQKERGAQDETIIRLPDAAEYERILEQAPCLRRWSIACELPGALELGERLHKRGIMARQFENTIFVVLSDHGDYWGEYGLIRKGAGLSESLARIPMVWAGYHVKNQSAPMDSHVSIADIFPTLCSAIGAKIPAGVQGRSLWPMLTGKEYPKEEFSSIVVQQGFGGAHVGLDSSLTFEQEGALTPGKIAYFDELNTWTQSGTSRMVRKDDWKLVMDNYGNGELYNLKKDPSEVDNLFGKKKYTAVQTELLTKLVAWELRLQDPLPLPRKRYHFKQDPYNYLQPEQ